MLARTIKVAYVLTTAMAVRGTLDGQLRYLHAAGFRMTVLSGPDDTVEAFTAGQEAAFIPVDFEREISPWRDLRALWQLWRAFRRLAPDLSHVGMPKAGLLGGLAAWLARVPCRVYTLHGLRLETARGGKRVLLKFMERLSCRLAHRVVCVSESVRSRAVELGLVVRSKAVVLGSGSANGVDLKAYEDTEPLAAAAQRKREELSIPQTAPVIGFVGRLTRDKGVPELVAAFQRLRDAYPDLRLLLLGPLEDGDLVPVWVKSAIHDDTRIVAPGFLQDTVVYYRLIDLLALPSYREGFPTVVLEAAAAGKPVVGTRCTGVVDAIVDGETGLLAPVGDVEALTQALARLLDEPQLTQRLGQAARRRACRHFQRERLWRATAALYRELTLQRSVTRVEQPQGLTQTSNAYSSLHTTSGRQPELR